MHNTHSDLRKVPESLTGSLVGREILVFTEILPSETAVILLIEKTK